MKITVTEEDIKTGWDWSYTRLLRKYRGNIDKHEERRCSLCPVAIALSRVYGVPCVAETYRLRLGDRVVRCPEVVSDWMYEFDCERTVAPFEFEIEDHA